MAYQIGYLTTRFTKPVLLQHGLPNWLFNYTVYQTGFLTTWFTKLVIEQHGLLNWLIRHMVYRTGYLTLICETGFSVRSFTKNTRKCYCLVTTYKVLFYSVF